MALPEASERKSYTFTLVSSPLACHSRPLFLKVPINSFFLQSTEIIGSPAPSNCLHRSLRCLNWASRSACEHPSMFFAVFTQRKAQFVQPLADSGLAKLMALLLQCFLQPGHAFRCPSN